VGDYIQVSSATPATPGDTSTEYMRVRAIVP